MQLQINQKPFSIFSKESAGKSSYISFTSPLNSGVKIKSQKIVHTKNSPKTGGFFGFTRSGGTKKHNGIDLEAEIGTSIFSSAEGIVLRSETSPSYGTVIYINHPNGYQTRYAHLSESGVKVGQSIVQGQWIGRSGKTGNANHPNIKPHLHFEIRKLNDILSSNGLYNWESIPIDPLPFITEQRG